MLIVVYSVLAVLGVHASQLLVTGRVSRAAASSPPGEGVAPPPPPPPLPPLLLLRLSVRCFWLRATDCESRLRATHCRSRTVAAGSIQSGAYRRSLAAHELN